MIFSAWRGEEELTTGSTGVGLSISEGVVCEIKPDKRNKSRTLLNGEIYQGTSTDPILCFFEKEGYRETFQIDYYSKLPVGAGFGTSAAASLSLAIALNNHFGSGFNLVQLGNWAHITEVRGKTGLGDVSGILSSGFEWRKKPGSPDVGTTIQLETINSELIGSPIFVASNGPIHTKSVLGSREKMSKINKIGREVLKNISRNITLKELLNYANFFSKHVDVHSTDIKKRMNDYREKEGGMGAMVMIGETIVCFGGSQPKGFDISMEVGLEVEGARLL